MSTSLQTTLTRKGWKTLLQRGLLNEIKFYDLKDNYHDYQVNATEDLVFPVTGSHDNITMSHCAFAESQSVPVKPLVQLEVESVTSNVQYNFVNLDCGYNINQPNLNIQVNLNPWFNQLNNSTYSFNMSGLTLNLWDYLTATIRTLDLTTKNYRNTRYLTDLKISWVPVTNTDLQNLLLLSPRYVAVVNNVRTMVDNSSNTVYSSPFFLSFNTYSINGNPVNNTACNFSLVPSEVGYWVNNNTFLDIMSVENNVDLDQFKLIAPAAKVGNDVYYLTNDSAYPTETGFIGYALNMFNVNGSGETLLSALTTQAKLFFKSYANYNSLTGIYNLPINLNATVANQEFNSINNKSGGQVTINFVYDSNDTTNPNIQFL